MKGMIRLSPSEMRDFLRYQPKMKSGVHALTQKIMHWKYCNNCGLMALNNDVTRKALKQPCVYEDE